MDTQEQIDRLRATVLIQSAELSSLLFLVQQMSFDEGFHNKFLRLRNEFAQKQLEQFEDLNPGTAARIQSLLDAHCKFHPIDYTQPDNQSLE